MAFQTATNPETGEKVVLVGDQWLPYSQSATNDQGQKAFLVNNQWMTAPSAQPAAKPEPSFLERAGTAATRGFEAIPENISGIGLGLKSAFGMKPEAGAQAAQIRADRQKEAGQTPGISFEELEKTYADKGLIEALKKAPSYVTEQILQSAPSMAIPLAAGAAAGAVSGPLAPITAPIAGIGTYGLQQFGSFMRRQAEEGATGETLDPGKAATAAALTAPVGYFADRLTLGLGKIPEKVLSKEIAAELAKRTGANVGARAATGATIGVIAESPTEVLEQMAERWQAGLPLKGDDAIREYKEAFFGAAAVGGVGGAASRALQRPAAETLPQKHRPLLHRNQLKSQLPKRSHWLLVYQNRLLLAYFQMVLWPQLQKTLHATRKSNSKRNTKLNLLTKKKDWRLVCPSRSCLAYSPMDRWPLRQRTSNVMSR